VCSLPEMALGGPEPPICSAEGSGSLLPLFADEHLWNKPLRAILYGVGMVYMFLGVSIVADMFMNSIEEITSRSKQVTKKDGRTITYKVWNPTVANLTLLALGSSAPEILLSVVETLNKDFYIGELGSATITGSASFNLLVIVGLCVFVIPSSELRRMKDMDVFVVTVIFMFFAYLWLAAIVAFITPGVVDIWEALITLAGEPALVYLAYLADIGALRRCRRCGKDTAQEAELVSRALKLLGLQKEDEDYSNTEIVLQVAAAEDASGFKKVVERGLPADKEKLGSVVEAGMVAREARAQRRAAMARIRRGSKATQTEDEARTNYHLVKPMSTGRPLVQFAVVQQSLSSELPVKYITTVRVGDHSKIGSVHGTYVVLRPKEMVKKPSGNSLLQSVYVTEPDSYEGSMEVVGRGEFSLAEGEMSKDIPVSIPRPSNGQWKPQQDEVVVKIESLEGVMTGGQSVVVEIGPIHATVVTYVPAHRKGVFCFPFERIAIQGASHSQKIQCIVERLDGCSGPAKCSYRTSRMSSVPGFDYEETEGSLEFPPGVTERFVEIEILPKRMEEIADKFLLILDEPEGAQFENDGQLRDSLVQTIMIGVNEADEGASKWLDATFNCDEMRLGISSWREQLVEAVLPNGSCEAAKEASWAELVFHVVCIPWKLFFAPIPPTAFLRGWVCFFASLGYIAFLTAIIGDMAEIFGCVLEIPDLVTGVSFVALGTSMPDLFASRHAAVEDPTADAAIINVTGSNSVNVFLGIGIPWSVGAVVWAVRGRTAKWIATYPDIAAQDNMRDRAGLVIQGAEELVFGVVVFAAMAALAIVVMMVRRTYVGGELGGPMSSKVLGALTLLILWLSYIGLVAWFSISGKTADAAEQAVVVGSVAALCVLCVMATSMLTTVVKGIPSDDENAGEDSGFIEEISCPPSPRPDGMQKSPKLGSENVLLPKATLAAADAAAGPMLASSAPELEPQEGEILVLDRPVLLSETSLELEARDVAAEHQAVRLHSTPPHPQAPKVPPQPEAPQAPQNVAMSLEAQGPLWRGPADTDEALGNGCPVVSSFLPHGCRQACCSLAMPVEDPRSSR